MKKLLSALMCIILLAAVFAACTTQTPPDETPAGATSTEARDPSSADPTPGGATAPVQTGTTESPATPSQTESPADSQTPVSPTDTAEPTPSTVTPTPDDREPIVFVLDSASGKAGDQVTLKLSVKNNPGIAGYEISVLYDDAVFEVVNVSNKIPGAYSISNKTEQGHLRVMATNSGVNPFKGDILFDEIVFKIKDGAKAGEYEIKPLLADGMDTVFQNFGLITENPDYPAAFEAGKITVS